MTEHHYVDCSDEQGEAAWTRTWQLHPAENRLVLTGNPIAIESPATGRGRIWLRLAPTAAVRTWDTEPSLVIERQEGVWRATPGATTLAYEHVWIDYTGGTVGRTRALQAWQRRQHPAREGRDGLLLSNTWGDRSRADRLSEEFVRAEIDRAADLGIEVVQLDDGWQKGRSANTVESGGVWNDFWATAADYWAPDPERFPHGLEPLVRHATGVGLRLGLWYAPDSSGECANWEKDAALLLGLWREHGISHFKLDAVKLTSARCEERFRALLDRLDTESGGAILVDLDTTAEARLGFWGRPAGTTIFVENRYTDWGSYFPHSTLRALWTLAHTVHPARLRMEFLNPARNTAEYGADPLRPSLYQADYLFASVMLASPLGWFENTGLSAEFIAAAAPLIALWKRFRGELHDCDIVPIGQRPDGYGWTGFACVDRLRVVRHLLVFRESNLDAATVLWLPSGLSAAGDWRQLAGTGDWQAGVSEVRLQLPEPRSFCWLMRR